MAKKSIRHANSAELVAFGQAIRAIRKRQDISQEALALAAGIDRSYMGGIERGEHNLALVNIVKLASTLQVSVHQLMLEAGL